MSDEKPSRPLRDRIRGRTAPTDVMVIGLGRFGSSMAIALEQNGRAVFGVDINAERVAELAPLLTQSAVADTADEATLRQLGADDFGTVIVAIGEHLESSILTTAALSDLEVPMIWSRADGDAHQRILERVGAHHVFQPARDMGRRVAHLVAGRLIEFVVLEDGFAIAEVLAPGTIVGRSLADLKLRARHGVTVVAIKPAGGSFSYATPDSVVQPADLVVVAGASGAVEAFAALA